MIKNNITIVIFQLILSVFWMGFMFLVALSSGLETFFYGNPIIRFAIVGLIIGTYLILGRLLKKNISFGELVFSGVLSVGIGLIFFLLAFLGEGKSLLDGAVATSLWRFPMDFYLLPQMYLVHLLGFSKSWMAYFLAIFLGAGLMVTSLFFSCLKFWARKRRRRREG